MNLMYIRKKSYIYLILNKYVEGGVNIWNTLRTIKILSWTSNQVIIITKDAGDKDEIFFKKPLKNILYLENNYLLNPWWFITLIVMVDFIPGIFLIFLLTISEMSLYVGAAILQIIS